jgi:hypothetical protein
MSANFKKMKYPERRPAADANKTDGVTHEAKTEHSDTDALSEELNFINQYLSCGHAKGRAHSKAAILDGRPGYFFVTSIDIGKGLRRDCIKFSTLVDDDIELTDFD